MRIPGVEPFWGRAFTSTGKPMTARGALLPTRASASSLQNTTRAWVSPRGWAMTVATAPVSTIMVRSFSAAWRALRSSDMAGSLFYVGWQVLAPVSPAANVRESRIGQVAGKPALELGQDELVDRARPGDVERVGRRRPHRDARPHDAHRRQCHRVGVDAAAGRDQVVGFRRDQAAEGDEVHVIVAEHLPVHALGPVVQLDRPGGAGDRVVERAAFA